MTDLEDLWEDLPTGTPPVDAILRAGRANSPRRKLVRPLIAVGATAALAAAFLVGTTVGDGPAGPGGPSLTAPSPVAFQADLEPALSCNELLAAYRDRALSMVTEWGWDGGAGVWPTDRHMLAKLGDVALQYGVRDSRMSAQSSSETGTNVQETGVDEPDTVKTDGKLVVRLRGDDLIVYDASGDSVVKRSTTHLKRFEGGEILLAGSTVVALGGDQVSARDDMTGTRRGSRVVTVDIAQPSDPKIESTVTYSSRVISARQHDSTIRLVMTAGPPALDFIQPGGKVSTDEALLANRLAIERSTIKDWLPTYDSGSGSKQLLDCTNVAVPTDARGLDTVSVVGLTATAPTKPHAIGLVGSATIAYESADHLYLAESPMTWGCFRCRIAGPEFAPRQDSGTTDIYDFELDGVQAIHVASGEVEGTIADRWSLDEADDVLRVAVGPSSETGNFNSVVTLKRQGEELVEIGRLDKLGKNEEIKGVRWFDDLAVLVTYREVDPLFTIDLANPARPRLIGKLKIPGYSDYLHPLSDNEMLGIGYEGSSAQIALFDTSDLAHVKRVDVEHYRNASTIAATDPRAFTWLPDRDTALTVLQQGQRVQIATLTIRNEQIRSKLTRVEYGDDAAVVRTLPLAGGRIALVTGEDVRFFDLP
ncbi:beta-propeller domain-containing protein [Aeromicrobium sp.]|uniref:beta-propeller domain-containing protein n=1 Tax=Aeromicrobium sp. TaxID=1871063 RepID=UPI002FC7505C